MSMLCHRCGTPVGMWTVDEIFDLFEENDAGFEKAIDLMETRSWPKELEYDVGHAELRLPTYGAWPEGDKRFVLQICADCLTYYVHLSGFDVSTNQLHRLVTSR